MNKLPETVCNNSGFGSTGVSDSQTKIVNLLFDDVGKINNSGIGHEPMYNIHLSSNHLYIDTKQVTFLPTGNHSTRGLILKECGKYKKESKLTPASVVHQRLKFQIGVNG